MSAKGIPTSPAIEVFARVHSDFEANVKFASVYLPASVIGVFGGRLPWYDQQ